MLQRIIQGKVNKRLGEQCLLSQVSESTKEQCVRYDSYDTAGVVNMHPPGAPLSSAE